MEEIFEKDDNIKRLIREEGLLKTSSGFTARVMHEVKATPHKAVLSYKPLLSKSTWIFIALSFISLTVISVFAVVSNNTDITFFDRLKPAYDVINRLSISLNMDSNSMMLATIIMASAGFLLLIDYLLTQKFRESFK